MSLFDFSKKKEVSMVFKKDSRLGRKGILKASKAAAEIVRQDTTGASLLGKRVRAEDAHETVEGVVKWQNGTRIGISVSSQESLRFADVSDCEVISE